MNGEERFGLLQLPSVPLILGEDPRNDVGGVQKQLIRAQSVQLELKQRVLWQGRERVGEGEREGGREGGRGERRDNENESDKR